MFSLSDVNLLAVLIAALASMVLGMLWFSPLMFGKQWMKLVGMTEKDAKPTARAFITETVGTLLGTFVIALLLNIADPKTMQEAITLGVLLWLAVVVPMELSAMAWTNRSQKLVLINAGNALVSVIVIVAILRAI